jgi:predicted kinase
MANDLTRKEAGYIAETLTLATLHAGRNAVFFCSLKDCDWYKDTFLPQLRLQCPRLKVGLIHVTAPQDSVLARSRTIARETGQPFVEADVVDALDSIIPSNIASLRTIVDYSCTIRNDDDKLVLLDGGDWKTFTDTFSQRKPERSQQESIVEHGATCLPCKDLRQPRSIRQRRVFSALQSSEENHKSGDMKFYGQFAHIRATLDYSYHQNYTAGRQMFQDAIINEFLDEAVLKDQNGKVCTTPTMPWIVFTAGAFGAGKSYTLQQLVLKGRFPLMAFVRVNPDEIRRYFPEFCLYVQNNPEHAGELTNKEAGYIAEILTLAGLRAGKNVIVDGSLRRSNWYREYYARLRQDYLNLRIAIIHVTAPREAVFKHAAVSRGRPTAFC